MLPGRGSEHAGMEQLDEALALLRRALELVDQCDDPFNVGPHLDLAISRLEEATSKTPRNDNFGEQDGNHAP